MGRGGERRGRRGCGGGEGRGGGGGVVGEGRGGERRGCGGGEERGGEEGLWGRGGERRMRRGCGEGRREEGEEGLWGGEERGGVVGKGRGGVVEKGERKGEGEEKGGGGNGAMNVYTPWPYTVYDNLYTFSYNICLKQLFQGVAQSNSLSLRASTHGKPRPVDRTRQRAPRGWKTRCQRPR